MKIRLPAIVPFLAILLTSGPVTADPLRGEALGRFVPIPEGAPPLPGERPAPEMVSLGKMLYFDPRLSEKQDMSCNSCHNLAMGGASGHGSLGGRLTPTVFNAVFNTAQFWDGRASDLKEQVVKSVMVNPAALLVTRGGAMTPNTSEMNIAKQRAAERLKSIPGYVPAFKKAFPSEADPITYDNIGRAIAAFETTLITPDAPFDRWLRGDDAALSEVQKQGLKLFMDKGCSNCHNGTNIGGGRFARFGVAKNPGPDLLPADDVGRFALTRDVNDKYVFKVPGLRNVELIPPYFHSGRIWDLNEAVAVMGETQLGQKLSGEETAKIAAFLKSLTGRQPEITIPALPPSVATTIRP